VSIYKSRTTPDHGLEARFFNALLKDAPTIAVNGCVARLKRLSTFQMNGPKEQAAAGLGTEALIT
jgi:hypothetical protein